MTAKQRAEQKEKVRKGLQFVKKHFYILLFLAVSLVMFFGFRNFSERIVGGLIIKPPEGFELKSSDTRNAVWVYSGKDRKPGRLILDEEIRGDQGQRFATAEDVLRDCDWMTEAELYVNPNGIRMARGFSTKYAGYPERRYYVECDKAVFLLCMTEDDRYYDPADCEEAMKQTADSIRKK